MAISKLPFSVLYLLSDFLYLVIYRFIGYRKKVVRQNLVNSFPEKPAAEIDLLVPAFYANFCDIIVETLKLASVSAEEFRKHVTLTNTQIVEPFVAAGKPVIMMGSHLANWEWALPAGVVSFNVPLDGIYKPLTNEFFEWFMLRLRTRLGAHLIPMKDTLRDFMRRKNIPRIISMLSDQTPPRGEIQYWTTFLNQETAFYVGADKLSASFKYPVIFVGNRRIKRGHYEFRFEMLHDLEAPLGSEEFPVTERYARKLEEWISQNPADYLWSHRRWKHKKPETLPINAAAN
jgi:KDO2-lipid IV(A) lauroyltransferase